MQEVRGWVIRGTDSHEELINQGMGRVGWESAQTKNGRVGKKCKGKTECKRLRVEL